MGCLPSPRAPPMDDSRNAVLRLLCGGRAHKSLDNAHKKSFINYEALKGTMGFILLRLQRSLQFKIPRGLSWGSSLKIERRFFR